MIALDNINADGRTIMLEAIDARSVRITTNHPEVLEYKEPNGQLVGLAIADKFLINTRVPDQSIISFDMGEQHGQRWTAKYQVTKLKRSSENVYIAQTMRLNNCSFFTLPMLGFDREHFGWDWSLANVYIGKLPPPDLDGEFKRDYDYCILVLTRFYYIDKYSALESRLKKHPNYSFQKSTDFQHILYAFGVPIEYRDDFTKVMHSKYSELSPKLKSEIMRFHKFSATGSMSKILVKDNKYRKQLELDLQAPIAPHMELFDLVDLEAELLTLTQPNV